MEKKEKDLKYWKKNADEDFAATPISVLRYIQELEQAVKNPPNLDTEAQLQKLLDWINNPQRERANTAFTSGTIRNIAYKFEETNNLDTEKKRLDRLIRANTEYQKRIELLRDEIEVFKGNNNIDNNPIHIHKGITNTKVEIINGIVQVSVNDENYLNNLLEAAREEAERRFKDNEIWHKRELYEALFKQGVEFIIDKLKEL